MNRKPTVLNGQVVHKTITPECVLDAIHRQMFGLDNPGFCLACGNEQEGCEPDAEQYECEACGEPQVYGAEMLIEIVADVE